MRQLFENVASRPAHVGPRKAWIISVTTVIYAAIGGALLIAPLWATNVLPAVDKVLEWEAPPKPPVPVKIKRPDRPKKDPKSGGTTSNDPEPRVPTKPPDDIKPEPPGPRPGPPGPGPDPCPGCLEVDVPRGPIPEPPPPPKPPDPPKPEPPTRLPPSVRQPVKIADVLPIYPDGAKNARVQGVVILEAVISSDGRVQDVKVLRSIPLLDRAAMDAVRQWRYTPTLLNGVPVSVIITVTLNFTLQ